MEITVRLPTTRQPLQSDIRVSVRDADRFAFKRVTVTIACGKCDAVTTRTSDVLSIEVAAAIARHVRFIANLGWRVQENSRRPICPAHPRTAAGSEIVTKPLATPTPSARTRSSLSSAEFPLGRPARR